MSRFAHVTGWGMAIPEKRLTNRDLEAMMDTSDEWIVSRTGIHERRVVGADESTATLATRAAMRAIDRTDLRPRDLDLVIVATATPEHLFPATACLVQNAIGATHAGAFDLSAACSGFLFAVNMAAQSIRTGALENALVIGAETLSRIVNWEDRATSVLFGDGAGAFVLQSGEEPGGVLSAVMRSDGSGGELLWVPAGGSREPTSHETIDRGLHTIQMNGREVFRFATRVMASATREAVAKAGLEMDDIQLLVPHQANKRIIESAARSLHLPMDRIMMNIGRYGNTSSASIPIAVCEAIDSGRLEPGDNVVMVAFGAGLTWGALAMKWIAPERRIPPTRRRLVRLSATIATVRSFLRRVLRRIEGLLWRAHASAQGQPERTEPEEEAQ